MADTPYQGFIGATSGGDARQLGEGGAATKIGDVATGILPVTWASNGVGGQ